MNYRQWKKKYKKIHGYNPPVEHDKRKRNKLYKRTMKNISAGNINEAVKAVINGVANCFDILADAFANIAKTIRV